MAKNRLNYDQEMQNFHIWEVVIMQQNNSLGNSRRSRTTPKKPMRELIKKQNAQLKETLSGLSQIRQNYYFENSSPPELSEEKEFLF
jgi:hypothetical protein